MRVQPHLPSRPLTATAIDSAGFAAWACRAANSPAPPAPRIRTSRRSRRRPEESATQAYARAFGIDKLGKRDAVLRRRVAREAHAGRCERPMRAGDVVGVKPEMRRSRGILL